MKNWLVVVRFEGKKQRFRLDGGSREDVFDYLDLLYGYDNYELISCVVIKTKKI